MSQVMSKVRVGLLWDQRRAQVGLGLGLDLHFAVLGLG